MSWTRFLPAASARRRCRRLSRRYAQRGSLSVGAASFLTENAHVRTIATLPSPYTVGGKMWSAERSVAAYRDPQAAMEACVPIINREIKALAALGIDAVQLDEPWLGDVPNPAYRASEGIGDIDRELELYVRSVNGAVEGVEGASLSVHVCGHTSPTTAGNRGWALRPSDGGPRQNERGQDNHRDGGAEYRWLQRAQGLPTWQAPGPWGSSHTGARERDTARRR